MKVKRLVVKVCHSCNWFATTIHTAETGWLCQALDPLKILKNGGKIQQYVAHHSYIRGSSD